MQHSSSASAVNPFLRRTAIALAVGTTLFSLPLSAQTQTEELLTEQERLRTLSEVRVTATAEDQLRQSLGVSVITEEDLERRPPANDLADILITQPGVSLSGASSMGSYGNQREIDLRGMGAENTMILVDGRPVQTRQGAFQRRTGDRDTGGDTNWVPVNQIERIEVIRGPAAARYGSGAAGGVINIITKKPTDTFSGSLTTYLSKPEDSLEGNGTRRLGFNLAGPVSEDLSFRLYGNVAKTDGDKPSINGETLDEESGEVVPNWVAGREGRRNRDINGLLRWDLNPDHVVELQAGFSRQGNIYAGERATGSPTETMQEWAGRGEELRRVYRQNLSLTHRGHWGELGDSRIVMQYENSRTHNCRQGAGRMNEGACNSLTDTQFSDMDNYFVNGELNTPLTLGGTNHMVTTGLEYRKQDLRDNNQVLTADGVNFTEARDYVDLKSNSWAAYVEDNIALTDALILTPGVRLDHHSQFGNNWSPSINAMYELGGGFTLKGGVARTFKAPTPYQTSPFYSSYLGGACPYNSSGLDNAQEEYCKVTGNPDLDPEVSVNQEIGIAWTNHSGWDASVAYFRNNYKNRIVAEATGNVLNPDGTLNLDDPIDFTWSNSGKALIHGLEGNLNVPLLGQNGNQLRLINNFTWMFSNKRKDTNQPLSIVPLYTLNSTLDWRATQEFSLQLSSTLYGRRKPRSTNYTGYELVDDAARIRGSYAIFALAGTYEFNRNHRLGFGVTNLFDRQIKRAAATVAGNSPSAGDPYVRTGAGALTYNEPGRAYYITYTASF